MKYIESLRKSLKELLSNDEKIYLLGEDIVEPYGGAFKVTKGLSINFPERLIATPMSEQGFSGMALGMAIAGLKPIVEIMFGDFVTLISDVLINHASVLREILMQPINIVFRTPMGGYRGYGYTHSKSVEDIFIRFPNINVVSPSVICDPGDLLKISINSGYPTLFSEWKLDYPRELFYGNNFIEVLVERNSSNGFPLCISKIRDKLRVDVVIISHGELIYDLLDIQKELFFESDIHAVLVSQPLLSDKNSVDIIKDIITSSKLVVIVQEGYTGGGWGYWLKDYITTNMGYKRTVYVVSAKKHIIGVSPTLENYVLPNVKKIKEKIVETIAGGIS